MPPVHIASTRHVSTWALSAADLLLSRAELRIAPYRLLRRGLPTAVNRHGIMLALFADARAFLACTGAIAVARPSVDKPSLPEALIVAAYEAPPSGSLLVAARRRRRLFTAGRMGRERTPITRRHDRVA